MDHKIQWVNTFVHIIKSWISTIMEILFIISQILFIVIKILFRIFKLLLFLVIIIPDLILEGSIYTIRWIITGKQIPDSVPICQYLLFPDN